MVEKKGANHSLIFLDNMIVHMENSRNSTSKLWELIKTFSKVVRYRSIQEINNDILKQWYWIMDKVIFKKDNIYDIIPNYKVIRSRVTKRKKKKETFMEIFIIPHIKEDVNKCCNILHSWIRWYFSGLSSPQTISKFNAIPIKISLIKNTILIKLFVQFNMLVLNSYEAVNSPEQ